MPEQPNNVTRRCISRSLSPDCELLVVAAQGSRLTQSGRIVHSGSGVPLVWQVWVLHDFERWVSSLIIKSKPGNKNFLGKHWI